MTEGDLVLEFDDDELRTSAPHLLVRYGIAEHLELRAVTPSAVVVTPDGGEQETHVEVDDFAVGGGWATKLSRDVQLSIVPVVTFPLGDDDVGAQGVEGHLQGNLGWKISPHWRLEAAALAGWVQEELPDGELDAHLRLLGGLLGSFWPVKSFGVFAQSYLEHIHVGTWKPVVGGGAMWRVVPPVQLHAFFNAGLTDEAPPPTAGAGFAALW